MCSWTQKDRTCCTAVQSEARGWGPILVVKDEKSFLIMLKINSLLLLLLLLSVTNYAIKTNQAGRKANIVI